MPPSNWPAPAPFWAWAAERYERNPQRWLALQAQGGNVNLALLLAWCDEVGRRAPPLHALETAIAPLEALLQEFRALRRRLKPQLAATDYHALLQHELRLEREQQARLLAAAALSESGDVAPGQALAHYQLRHAQNNPGH